MRPAAAQAAEWWQGAVLISNDTILKHIWNCFSSQIFHHSQLELVIKLTGNKPPLNRCAQKYI
jgi:hypothetical protein